MAGSLRDNRASRRDSRIRAEGGVYEGVYAWREDLVSSSDVDSRLTEGRGAMIVRLDDRPDSEGVRRRFGRSGNQPTIGSVVDLAAAVAMEDPEGLPFLATEDENWSPKKRRQGSGVWVMAVADFISLTIGLAVGLLVLTELSPQPANSLARFGPNFRDDLTFPVMTVLALAIYGLYQKSNRRFRKESFGDLGRIAHAMAVGGFLTLGAGVLIHRIYGSSEIHPAQLFSIAIVGLIAVPLGRAGARRLRHSNQENRDRVLIVGSGMMVERIRGYFEGDPSVELVGAVDDDPKDGSDVVGTTEDLPRICKELNIDRVLIGFSRTHPSDLVEQMRPMQGKVAISIVPRYFELLTWRSQVDDLCGLPMIDVAPPELSTSARFIKRTFDVAVATVGLIALSPILLLSAIAIKISSRGPVFFHQQRVGRSGRPFTIYKLRTMHTNAEQIKAQLLESMDEGELFKIKEDPRVHRVGRILRKTSLDEIPQLFNVLKGDMALVGPRPFIVEESERLDGWAARRFEVRPGLTGLWQVSGRSNLNFDELRRLDYLYVASWSLKWDLRIMWHTPACVLQSRGAY